MATYKDLQDRVTRRAIDVPDSVVAEIPQLVNEAIGTLQDEHNFRVMEGKLELTTNVGVRVLAAKPNDWKELRDVEPYYVDNTGNTVRLRWLPTKEMVLREFSDSDPSDKGKPSALLIVPTDDDGGFNIELYPYPDGQSDYADGEYRIKIPYWRYLPDLVADADTNWFTINAEEYIVFKATAEALYLDWNEQRAQMWEARAAGQARRVVNLDKRGRLASADTLHVRRDVFARRSQSV